MESTRDRLEKSARDFLYGSPVFFPARSMYQLLFNRHKYNARRQWRKFYEPFVRRGDLVFDVGANVGGYVEVFSDLGARVVAVEPNPQCCQNLARLARVRDVYVEQCAAGEVPGRATLRVCEQSVLSTLSEASFQNTLQHPLLQDVPWVGTLDVEVVTLDQLASRYGVPHFIKIDAEGYDDHVIRGMSFAPAALSFEFIKTLPDVAMRCLDILPDTYEFNYMPESEQRLIWDLWVPAEKCRERLQERIVGGEEVYGDIVARITKR